MLISEIFRSIQGEGRYQGTPVVFVRTSGCNRKCTFCDSKYHTEGKVYTVKELIKELEKFDIETIVFTGGEPLIYIKEIKEVIYKTNFYNHIETNGDLIEVKRSGVFVGEYNLGAIFDYICISPKEIKTARNLVAIPQYYPKEYFDIKVVTDLDKVGVDMVKFATSLMPLTVYNDIEDQKIRQRVWDYCVDKNLHYSGRMHVGIWGQKKGI
jgi:organic radical activating enzyme